MRVAEHGQNRPQFVVNIVEPVGKASGMIPQNGNGIPPGGTHLSKLFLGEQAELCCRGTADLGNGGDDIQSRQMLRLIDGLHARVEFMQADDDTNAQSNSRQQSLQQHF